MKLPHVNAYWQQYVVNGPNQHRPQPTLKRCSTPSPSSSTSPVICLRSGECLISAIPCFLVANSSYKSCIPLWQQIKRFFFLSLPVSSKLAPAEQPVRRWSTPTASGVITR